MKHALNIFNDYYYATAYLVYDTRKNRFLPAISKHEEENAEEFYNDQYSSRDKTFNLDKLELDKKRKERELLAQKLLEKEVSSMENLITKNNK